MNTGNKLIEVGDRKVALSTLLSNSLNLEKTQTRRNHL